MPQLVQINICINVLCWGKDLKHTNCKNLDTIMKLYISMPKSSYLSKEVLIVSLNICLAKLCSVCTSVTCISLKFCKGLLVWHYCFYFRSIRIKSSPMFFEKLLWTRASWDVDYKLSACLKPSVGYLRLIYTSIWQKLVNTYLTKVYFCNPFIFPYHATPHYSVGQLHW